MLPRVIAKQLGQALSVTEVPHSRRAIATCCDKSSLSGVEAPCSDLCSLNELVIGISLLHVRLQTLTSACQFQCPRQR
jgi:hypothetical protein